ncbi:MAG: glycosyltransferase [Alistipes sp.]|nr:glycosyltransferase [Alistipes sp.]
MKISYIIPVYKVEQYLVKSVTSVLAQTYKNIEVVLVDDGSPDNCPMLCDQIALEDERIKVLHKPNGGLSDARNAGLKIATGDYVVFMDSDDLWIGEDSLDKLVSLIKRYPECNFYGFNCQYYYPNSNTYTKWIQYADELLTPVSGNTAMVSLVKSGTFPMSACLKVIDRQWLIDNKIIFKVGQIAEDIPWFINLLEKTDKCMFVNNYIYAYRQNVAGSITASGGERAFNSVLDIVKNELALIDKRYFTEEAIDALRSFLAYEVSILIATVYGLPKEKQDDARAEIKQLCWLLRYTKNPKVRMVSCVYSVWGFSITERLLRIYNWYRKRK